LDEKSGYRPVEFARRMQELHDKNVKVEVPNTNLALEKSNRRIVNQTIGNIQSHETAIAPTPRAPTNTYTPAPTHTPANTLTVFPTFTPTPTRTSTPSLAPLPTPHVVLTRFEYDGSGEGCSAFIYYEVSGGPATGYFRVTNGFYKAMPLPTPPYDPNYPLVTLPVSTTNNYRVGLGGNGDSAYYYHEVWFEYSGGGESNHLYNLICPGLTPPTPTP
jgi:hypothetical protein